MPSPFPGMDPYLEGHLWPDVHHRLATEISRALAPRLRPRYVARIEVTIVEDRSPEAEVGIMYPDVEVPRRGGSEREGPGLPRSTTNLAAPLTLPLLVPVELRIPSVEVRSVQGDELVTAIEIISPVNKREPQAEAYRAKRERLRAGGAHVLELDLLRRGARVVSHPKLPPCEYLVTLTRARAGRVEVWPLHLRDALPTLPVPLRDPDPDSWFDLGAALQTIYTEAGYDLSIDYAAAPPPPPLSPELEAWRRSLALPGR